MVSYKMTEKARLKRILKDTGVILAIGIAYFIFVTITGFYIPCLIRTLTGYLCPGCGISHYFVHMAHFEFREAFRANPYVFFFVPVAVPYWAFKSYQYIKTGETKYSLPEKIVIGALIIAAIVFGIVRNL